MTLTITLTPENQTRLQQQAQAAGLPLETHLDRYVNEQLSQPPGATLPEPMPLEEWELLLRSGTISAPPISPEALRRESETPTQTINREFN